MANPFIAMVFGYLKEQGVDTKDMSVQEAIDKFQEMNKELGNEEKEFAFAGNRQFTTFKNPSENSVDNVVKMEENESDEISQEKLKELSERMAHRLSPQETYEISSILTKETADKTNYHTNSIGFWEPKETHPERDADFTSNDKRSKKPSSQYWYEDGGVYRKSDHWGTKVGTCSWYIKGREYKDYGVEFGKDEIAFIAWGDLKGKGVVVYDFNTKQYKAKGYNFKGRKPQ